MLSLATRTLKLEETVKFNDSTNVLLSNTARHQLPEMWILSYREGAQLPWAVSSMSGLVTESFPPKSELHSDLRSSILLGISSDVALIPYT